MKKIIKQLLIGSFALLTVTSCSKNDDDDPKPPAEKQTEIYTGGFVLSSAGGTTTHIATLWENGVAQQLSNAESWVNKVLVVGNDVYAVGREYQGSKSVAKLWKNGVATSSISSSNNTEAFTCAVSASGDVYILVREWSNIVNEYKVLKNNIPVALNHTNANTVIFPYDVFVSGSDVYVSGSEYSSATNLVKAVVWKNGIISSLADVSANAQNEARKIFVSDNNVYAVGSEAQPNGNNIVVLWKNGVPTSITDGTKDGSVYALCVSGNDIYITSSEYNHTTFNSVATLWKNGTPIFTRNGDDFSFTSVAVLNNNWYLIGDGLEVTLWKNGVQEAPAIQDASVSSISVVEK